MFGGGTGKRRFHANDKQRPDAGLRTGRFFV